MCYINAFWGKYSALLHPDIFAMITFSTNAAQIVVNYTSFYCPNIAGNSLLKVNVKLHLSTNQLYVHV